MRALIASAILLVALPAAATPLVVCGSETALENQRQMGLNDKASDCWMDDSSRYRFGGEHVSLIDSVTRVVDLIDRKANAGHGGSVVTTAKAWKR